MSQSGLGPVQTPSTLRGQVVRALSAAIISGELPPDTLVTVPTLAAQFGVSATPVREAILELERLRFVTSVRNKGFRIVPMNAHDLAEISETRMIVEPAAMGLLAPEYPERCSPAQRAQAREIAKHAEAHDLARFIAVDNEFHLGLMQLHGNRRLTELVGDLRMRTRLTGLGSAVEHQHVLAAAQEHFTLLDRLEAGDASGARRVMRTHIRTIFTRWMSPGLDDRPASSATGD